MSRIPTPPTKLNSKQIDKLMKLIRLANYNSAENEANSAARQVCKMLDGYIFKPDVITAPSNPKNTSSAENPWTDRSWENVDDLFRDAFGGGFRTRQQSKEERYQAPGTPPPGSKKEAKKGDTETKSEPHVGFDPAKDFAKEYEDAFKRVRVTEEEWHNFTSMSDEDFLKFMRAKRDSQKKEMKICMVCHKEFIPLYDGHYTCVECMARRK